MINKPTDLCGLSPQELCLIGNVSSHPVCVDQILDRLGINFDDFDFTETERICTRGKVLGAIIASNVLRFRYRDDCSESERQYALAYMLATCCLQGNKIQTGMILFDQDQDSILSSFAGRILVPRTELQTVCNSMIVPVLDVLAEEFRVSEVVMAHRLEEESVPYYIAQNS